MPWWTGTALGIAQLMHSPPIGERAAAEADVNRIQRLDSQSSGDQSNRVFW